MRWKRTALVALTLLVLAGCVRPPAEPDVPPVTQTAPYPTIELPPRPRDVPLDGLDPCTLLKPHLAELELEEDREPLLTVSDSPLYGGVTSLCTARGYEPRAISVAISLVTIRGIELFTVDGVDATVSPIGIRGFPAVLVVPPRSGYCTVIVDVAPGQLIDVGFADGGRVPPVPDQDLCDDAHGTAGLAMDTLLTLR